MHEPLNLPPDAGLPPAPAPLSRVRKLSAEERRRIAKRDWMRRFRATARTKATDPPAS